MQKHCSITYENEFMLPLRALVELCDIRISGNRPICELMCKLENWLPETNTNNSGKGNKIKL